jgi:very-short-patch-repair endonuclease
MPDTARGEVLVAIINDRLDFQKARDEHWYRIPVSSVDKWLRRRWPPTWLALYQTRVFGDEAYCVRYYAEVLDIQRAYRWQLIPEQARDQRGMQEYHKLILGPLEQLPQPIFSRRHRRIVFIPTTWQKFVSAIEINDLYDESPLEDRLWAEFRRLQIPAERQEFVGIPQGRSYALDFALYCTNGRLNVETDGDTWHADPARIPLDNLRDNDLETAGWKLLRFNTLQIQERMTTYCVPTIIENIRRLGGPEEGRLVARSIDPQAAGQQLGLFDD